MPELPEVETVRRSIEPTLTGAMVRSVRLLRADIVRAGTVSSNARELLAGDTIESLTRLGKQLAIRGSSGNVLVVQLGMTGALLLQPNQSAPPATHVHCIWELKSPRGNAQLLFHDPRRFGGLSCFPSFAELQRTKWAELGPDALTVSAPSRRPYSTNPSSRASEISTLTRHSFVPGCILASSPTGSPPRTLPAWQRLSASS